MPVSTVIGQLAAGRTHADILATSRSRRGRHRGGAGVRGGGGAGA
ncbi:MAG TPA: hypothetical protein VNQ77_07960 [Frankiaceae bacterium]|nr:hypothetical protein [Frankiaceae bacterium]